MAPFGLMIFSEGYLIEGDYFVSLFSLCPWIEGFTLFIQPSDSQHLILISWNMLLDLILHYNLHNSGIKLSSVWTSVSWSTTSRWRVSESWYSIWRGDTGMIFLYLSFNIFIICIICHSLDSSFCMYIYKIIGER